MKIRIIHGFAPIPKRFMGITLYPFIFTWCKKDNVPESFLRHEMIHVRQIQKVGWFCFYASYFFYWLAGLLEHKNLFDAYFEIPYEIETRKKANQSFH